MIIGTLLLLFGILFFIVGIRPISGFEQIYFYWSFSYVNPFAGLKPGIYPGFPAVVNTYEILIPWVLLGIVSSGLGIITLAKGIVKKFDKAISVKSAGAIKREVTSI
ncbi:MAG: hypothetical protein ACP5NK_07765 [Thermoplasmata archaeon]